MEQYTIFEIPIYSMKEKEFSKRWDKFFEKIDNEESRQLIENYYFPMNVWRYNQIIGYIVISISKNDIWFDWYQSLDENHRNKKFHYKSEKKHFIHLIGSGIRHFRVEKEENNQEIKEKIREWLDEILDYYEILKRYYVDTSIFESQIKYFDIRKAIDEI